MRHPVAIFSLFCVLLFSGCSKLETENSIPEVIQAGELDIQGSLPEFSRPMLRGGTLTSNSLSGKITLINFWATWCGPCVVEIPEFVALKKEWIDRPFEIVGVSLDETGFEAVMPFADDFYLNYPQILDLDGALGDGLGGIFALPATFVIDERGAIVKSYLGVFPMEVMRAELDKWISKIEGKSGV